MKISARTLNAARRAAEARGMSLDSWAEQALAEAAAPKQSLNVEARLREISDKIDRLADRQSLGDRASEQLAAAVQELGDTYNRTRKNAGQLMSEAETRASSTAEELTAKARELIATASKTATDFVGSFTSRVGDGSETGAEPTESKPSQSVGKSVDRGRRQSKGTTKSSAARRKTKNEKPRGSQRRRSQQ